VKKIGRLHYVNEICCAVPDTTIKLYADDTNLFLYDKDLNNLQLVQKKQIRYKLKQRV